jgi:hypothetical protein
MSAESIARGLGARRSGRGWTARCPAHRDRSPSLSITEKDGRVLVHCHAGCEQRDVIDALRTQGLWPEHERREWTPADRARWAAERRAIEKDLPAARYWRRTAVNMAEGLLLALKSALVDPIMPAPAASEIAEWTRELARLGALTSATLVDAYRTAMKRDPEGTAGMVRRARQMERAEIRAVLRLMSMTPAEWAALPVTEWQP